jgi:hypothetical protein
MSNISGTGHEYIVTEGDSETRTVWDGMGTPWFWAMDNLIVNYWGDDTTVITLINQTIGQPFAGSSSTFRPEAGSGAIVGSGKYGVSFQGDAHLATNLEAEITHGRPSTGPNDFVFDVMPDHLTYIFQNTYADDWTIYHQTVNIPSQPQILIFPLAAYASMNPIAAAQIAQLDDLLQNRPAVPPGALPHLPPPNGQQDLQAQLAYLDFSNGSGIRYLTQFNQEPRQINNQEVYYTFQGITADHAYYIAAFFPVQSDSLPADNTITDYDAFANNMLDYLTKTTAILNNPATTFTPDLALLDAIVQSLYVKPNVALETPTLP